MKIECHCGALIVDQTDDLPHKAWLIPDQAWFGIHESLDEQVIDAIAAGKLDKCAAYRPAREIVGRSARPMYQCRACGRLYINDVDRTLQCYVPTDHSTARAILRSKNDDR